MYLSSIAKISSSNQPYHETAKLFRCVIPYQGIMLP